MPHKDPEKQKQYNKQYRQKNKEQIAKYNKQYKKQYRQKNKEQILEQKKQHYQENKEQICEHNKQYRQKNKEQICEQKKQYYQENKEKICEQKKQYRQENKENGTTGLYLILNTLNGYVYIGESVFYERRKYDHERRLKSGRHPNSLLQKDYDKYGADAFEFSMIKEIKKEGFQSEKELKEHLRVEEAMLILKEVEAGKELYNLALNPIYMVAALQERLAENELNSPSQ